MADLRSLNAELASIQGALNYESLLAKVVDAQQKLVASTVSKLGTKIDEVVSGFTSLTQEVDQGFSSLKDKLPGGIAMLTENPPGLDVKKPISQLNSQLEALTEGTVAGGFLNIDITLGTPQAVATALARITDKPVSQIKEAAEGLIPDELKDLKGKLDTALGDLQKGISFAKNIEGMVGEFTDKLAGQIKGNLLNVLQDLPNELASAIAPLNTAVKNVSSSAPIDKVTQDTTFISSQVEMQAILASAQREITTVVVGSTKTFKDIDIRASDTTDGWHFIITRDGELQQVTPIDTVGSYTANYNQFTVGVAFVGGIQMNRAGGRDQQDFEQHVTTAAITRAQWNTFDKMMTQFFNILPFGQALGVSDIEPDKTIAPGFDVKDYVRARFNKQTILEPADGPMSMKALQAMMATSAEKLIDPKIADEPGEV